MSIYDTAQSDPGADKFKRRDMYPIGARVTYAGYPGTVREVYSEGMRVVQLASGQVCVAIEDLRHDSR